MICHLDNFVKQAQLHYNLSELREGYGVML